MESYTLWKREMENRYLNKVYTYESAESVIRYFDRQGFSTDKWFISINEMDNDEDDHVIWIRVSWIETFNVYDMASWRYQISKAREAWGY